MSLSKKKKIKIAIALKSHILSTKKIYNLVKKILKYGNILSVPFLFPGIINWRICQNSHIYYSHKFSFKAKLYSEICIKKLPF